jgi:hypothetical protein
MQKIQFLTLLGFELRSLGISALPSRYTDCVMSVSLDAKPNMGQNNTEILCDSIGRL